jgi:hypothetical protein
MWHVLNADAKFTRTGEEGRQCSLAIDGTRELKKLENGKPYAVGHRKDPKTEPFHVCQCREDAVNSVSSS